jgi:hypothetical protein
MTHKPRPTTRTEATARMNLMVTRDVCARVIRHHNQTHQPPMKLPPPYTFRSMATVAPHFVLGYALLAWSRMLRAVLRIAEPRC